VKPLRKRLGGSGGEGSSPEVRKATAEETRAAQKGRNGNCGQPWKRNIRQQEELGLRRTSPRERKTPAWYTRKKKPAAGS